MDRRTPGYGRLSAKGNLRQVELQISIVNVNYRFVRLLTKLAIFTGFLDWPQNIRTQRPSMTVILRINGLVPSLSSQFAPNLRIIGGELARSIARRLEKGIPR